MEALLLPVILSIQSKYDALFILEASCWNF